MRRADVAPSPPRRKQRRESAVFGEGSSRGPAKDRSASGTLLRRLRRLEEAQRSPGQKRHQRASSVASRMFAGPEPQQIDAIGSARSTAPNAKSSNPTASTNEAREAVFGWGVLARMSRSASRAVANTAKAMATQATSATTASPAAMVGMPGTKK